ncbi:hypothetical protein [Weissella confusa]|uniref:hypothetical protein n=1 Tax=Weissella confusa TaxID=1583 RepID=UPI001680C710|nr:hypothetical protein [Weissella confusa]MBD1490994.1 hypothetical protein [Weissella confusa]MBJ7662930.1 hypothetical protein [Weissella confusa]
MQVLDVFIMILRQKKWDILVSIGLMLLLIFLFVNGNHASPREARYDETVEYVNKRIDDRVLSSQTWYMNQKLDELNARDSTDDLPWNVADNQADAFSYTLRHDQPAKQDIENMIKQFDKWLKDNRYTKKEVATFKIQLYKPHKSELDRVNFELNKMRTEFSNRAHERIKALKAEQEATEISRANSIAATASANASLAAEWSSVAAERAMSQQTSTSEIYSSQSQSAISKSSVPALSSVVDSSEQSSASSEQNDSSSESDTPSSNVNELPTDDSSSETTP